MKALAWHQFLQRQRDEHRKVVFTVTELANVAKASPRVINVELGRLVERGVLVRYSHGRYGLPGQAVGPAELLQSLDSSAYITGMYALSQHNLITQVPTAITCFTNRRHNLSRERLTPLGKFVFVCVSPKIYSPPEEGCLASPEQAFCDFLYLTCRQGFDPRNLVTFYRLDRLDDEKLSRLLERYPASTRRAAKQIRPGRIL